jgi:hypothetical protein
MMNLNKFGSKRKWPNLDTIPASAWTKERDPWKI